MRKALSTSNSSEATSSLSVSTIASAAVVTRWRSSSRSVEIDPSSALEVGTRALLHGARGKGFTLQSGSATCLPLCPWPPMCRFSTQQISDGIRGWQLDVDDMLRAERDLRTTYQVVIGAQLSGGSVLEHSHVRAVHFSRHHHPHAFDCCGGRLTLGCDSEQQLRKEARQ